MHIYKAGDRVSINGSPGTVIRVSGIIEDIAIVALDSDIDTEQCRHFSADEDADKKLGIDISRKWLEYRFFTNEFMKPIAEQPTTPQETKRSAIPFTKVEVGDVVMVRIKAGCSYEVKAVVVSAGVSPTLALQESVCGYTVAPLQQELVVAEELGVELTKANCWVCVKGDTEILAIIGKHKAPEQKPAKTQEVSLVPAMMVVGTAIGGLLGLLTAPSPTVRTAEVEAETDMDATEELASEKSI